MARNVFYKKEDDAKLMALWNDNKDGKKFTELAEMAQRYGICPERDRRALAQHISLLVNPKKKEDLPEEMDPDLGAAIHMAEIADDRYRGLLDAIVDSAALYKGKLHNSLALDFRAILRWLWNNEPERIAARIEALELAEGTR